MKKVFKFSTLLVVAVLALGAVASAQTVPVIPSTGDNAPITGVNDATGKFTNYIAWFYGLFWVLAFAFLVWAAITYLTANGDAEKVGEAKKRVIYAVIAACIALLANGIKLIATSILSGS